MTVIVCHEPNSLLDVLLRLWGVEAVMPLQLRCYRRCDPGFQNNGQPNGQVGTPALESAPVFIEEVPVAYFLLCLSTYLLVNSRASWEFTPRTQV